AARTDLEELQSECLMLREVGKGIKFLRLPGIEQLRASLLDDTEDACAFADAKIRALKDPAALREYKPAAEACSAYIDALEGKTDLEQTWRETVQESCKRNADPAACVSRRADEAQKPDGKERKRLFVLGFGWNNCAVRFMRSNGRSKQR